MSWRIALVFAYATLMWAFGLYCFFKWRRTVYECERVRRLATHVGVDFNRGTTVDLRRMLDAAIPVGVTRRRVLEELLRLEDEEDERRGGSLQARDRAVHRGN